MKSKQNTSADETRNRLIRAALQLFGRSGKDAVSTRQLAQKAGTNLNAIQYHFGGKHELHMEVARELAKTSGARARKMSEDAVQNLQALSSTEAAHRAADLMVRLTGILITLPEAAAHGGFMLREQLEPSEAFNSVIYPGFIEPIHLALTALVAKATNAETTDSFAITRAHVLFGQALAFVAARETWNRRLGTNVKAEHALQLASDAIRHSTFAMLTTSAPPKETVNDKRKL